MVLMMSLGPSSGLALSLLALGLSAVYANRST